MTVEMSRVTMFLVLAAALMAARAGPAAVIELHETVVVTGERIVLGDLGEISDAGEEAQTLAEVDIGPAPLPGRARALTVGYLKMRLRRSGIDCADLTFVGAGTVRVRAAGPIPRPAAGAAEDDEPAQEAATPTPIVPRGAVVQITVRCGAVWVTADATTLEEAPVGGMVRLRIEQTRETVTARLVSSTAALIDRQWGVNL